jgi:hypothetical protein
LKFAAGFFDLTPRRDTSSRSFKELPNPVRALTITLLGPNPKPDTNTYNNHQGLTLTIPAT